MAKDKSHLVVTTFPEWGWDVYAEHCMRSWTSKWPGSVLAYYEGDAPLPPMPGVEFRPLDQIEARQKFLHTLSVPAKNYLFDAKKFSHKVFAQLDALQDNDIIWWLDADVEAVADVPSDLLDRLERASFTSFLGRDTYTETGVIAFNKFNEGFSTFANLYRNCYENKEIYNLRYWTDCHAFDHARQGRGYNMTPGGSGVDNVLEQSELGPYLIHHKGNLKLKVNEIRADLELGRR